ncbi:hypothetical protein OYE22_16650 [Streptomyces sp. 71268]|uniref:hypothetical protein n=1 Tax=Streptomyces sp. 71268 TaxID=3002640 RepID=UPI0023F95C3A|nr:hypothetical protein [Streptomyces sp. 71268]WEV26645.1 hypothetical protein OYE22_16650 [Streptomyces sp. 71268]
MGSDPRAARTPAEYVAALREIRDETGLSYRQLERRADAAGEVLPRATVAGALARTALPRAELVTAFVRACGGDAASVDAWLDARERLAAGARTEATAQRVEEPAPRVEAADPPRGRVSPGPPGAAEAGHPAPRDPAPPPEHPGASRSAGRAGAITPARDAGAPHEPVARHGRWWPTAARRPLWLFVPVSLGAGVGAALALSLTHWLQSAPRDQGTDPAPEPSGWVTMRPVEAPRLCVTEGRERNRRTDRPVAVQRPCERAPRPRVFLEHVSGSTYRVQWHHPVHKKGCLSVDEPPHGAGEGEELVSPRACTGQPHQRFRLEPVGRGYRLRPLDSGLCLGLLPPRTEGAELVQALCTGYEDQSFRFERPRSTTPHPTSPRSSRPPSANQPNLAATWPDRRPPRPPQLAARW